MSEVKKIAEKYGLRLVKSTYLNVKNKESGKYERVAFSRGEVIPHARIKDEDLESLAEVCTPADKVRGGAALEDVKNTLEKTSKKQNKKENSDGKNSKTATGI